MKKLIVVLTVLGMFFVGTPALAQGIDYEAYEDALRGMIAVEQQMLTYLEIHRNGGVIDGGVTITYTPEQLQGYVDEFMRLKGVLVERFNELP